MQKIIIEILRILVLYQRVTTLMPFAIELTEVAKAQATRGSRPWHIHGSKTVGRSINEGRQDMRPYARLRATMIF